MRRAAAARVEADVQHLRGPGGQCHRATRPVSCKAVADGEVVDHDGLRTKVEESQSLDRNLAAVAVGRHGSKVQLAADEVPVLVQHRQHRCSEGVKAGIFVVIDGIGARETAVQRELAWQRTAALGAAEEAAATRSHVVDDETQHRLCIGIGIADVQADLHQGLRQVVLEAQCA